jgi:hypothetical protein
VSDVHGGYDRLAALLAKHGVARGVPSTPDAMAWGAGSATLVAAGDLVDKGPRSIEVIDGLRALQASAASAGGRVIVLLGNHEAELLADPENDKALKDDGIDAELAARGEAPEAFASPGDERGGWLGGLPVAARVGGWFFAHAGDTAGRTIDAIEADVARALPARGFADDVFVGDGSLLESRGWATDAGRVAANLAGVGAEHLVMGHDPHALGPAGAIAATSDASVLRVDCGMSPDVDDSRGALLRVRHEGADDVAEALDADGGVTLLWRGAR